MDLLAFILALQAEGKTAEEVKAAVDQYIEDNPTALDQAAVEAILDGRLDHIVLAQQNQPTAEDNRIWFPTGAGTTVQVPTYEEHSELKSAITQETTPLYQASNPTVNNEIVWSVDFGYYGLSGTSLVWNTSKNYVSTRPNEPIAVKSGDIIRLKNVSSFSYFVLYSSDGTEWESLSNTRASDLRIEQNGYVLICARKSPSAVFTDADIKTFFTDAICIIRPDYIPDSIKITRNNLALANEKGLQTFGLFSNFQGYGLNTNGTFLLSQKYRVSCEHHIKFDHDITVHVADGFRWGYIPFSNGTSGTWSGWKTADFTVPSGTEFVVQIARASEITSEIADINEFVSSLTFNTNTFTRIESNNSDLETIVNTLVNYDGNFLNGIEWTQGIVTQGGEAPNTTAIRTNYIDASGFDSVKFYCDSGYSYFYILYSSSKEFLSAIPHTSDVSVANKADVNFRYIRVVLRHYDRTEDISVSESAHIHASGGGNIANIIAESNRINVVENVFRRKPFFSHLGVNKSSNIIIPNQSIFDVARTKRLGFDVIELNAMRTSDGNYICLHGKSGKFGSQVVDTNGESIADVVISSVTLAWIKENVRFVSKYGKYQVAPCTLQEMLYECKKYGVMPLVQYINMNEVAIINDIMGKGNYILNLYSTDRDGKTDGVCVSWTAIPDVDDAVAKCKASGQCYMLGVNNNDSSFSSFTDSDWKDYINAIHAAGYWVVGSYMTPQQVVKYLDMGWDSVASIMQVNDIETGNILNLFADMDYDGFSHNGTLTDGVLTLANGQVVTTQTTPDSVFLGGGSLHITFNGTISVNMGGINHQFTSDGTHDTWISTYFEEQVPKFTITAIGNVTITELSYKASRM